MTPQQLIAAALAQRETFVPLEDGKRVKIRRPSEVAIPKMLRRNGDAGTVIHAGLEEVKAHVVGWEGFSEADFMAGGASDPVDFDAGLWAVWIEDHRDAIGPVSQALVDAIVAHEKRVVETEKN